MPDKIKILVVDDEVKFLESIARRLEMRNLDVAIASDGQKAVDIARTKKFDLALLDLKMPGLNGIQVLEILKKEHEFIEVIILTGHGSIKSAVECTKLGAFGYLPKPYELERLLETLKNAYAARMKKKFNKDDDRLDKIMKIASGNSPLGILKELQKLDDEMK
ncbi:response regulator [candidate division KSB1 bacterium]